MHIHKIKADRAATVSEMRAALSAGNNAEFEKLAKQIEAFDAQINAEERMAAFEARQPAKDSLESEIRAYSVSAAVTGYVNGRLEGREAEVAQELRNGAQTTRGMRIPLSAIADYERREVTANPAFQNQSFQNLIPRLAPASHVIQAGATVLSGLGYGSISFPRMVGGPDANISWVAESGAVSQGSATFDNVTLAPKTAGVFLKVSRKALVTNSIGLDTLLRSDLNTSIGRAVDKTALVGGGTNEPEGIMSTVAATVFGDANDVSLHAADLMNAVEVEDNDGDVFFISQGVANLARRYRNALGMPVPLATQFYDKKVVVTNNVSGNKLVYGKISDLVVGFWNQAGTAPSVDIIVDTATYSSEGAVKLVGFVDVDVALKQGSASFAWGEAAVSGS
ncbi:phage major capsid protein [Rhizobium sullae]|uniref:Phage major capsid protein n=1 Tax=Rhizobium sullae TaxID=50338 RepID=A0ABY5XP25_RHISU|nr:phage major capsid protein [Rhizobium sullae]UWU16006.1 phage major capsid protein [Rhizobium sullae]